MRRETPRRGRRAEKTRYSLSRPTASHSVHSVAISLQIRIVGLRILAARYNIRTVKAQGNLASERAWKRSWKFS